jgi:hypothetical protein
MYRRILIACLGYVALIVPSYAADWALEIVPTHSAGDVSDIDTRGAAFLVLMTNTTDHNLNVWTDEYSWGYDNLSFDVKRSSGKAFRIIRVPEMFTMNMALPYLVRPGAHYAWAVTLASDKWNGFPPDWKGSEEVTIQAKFEIDPTKESKELTVWTGMIKSKPMKTTLVRYEKKSSDR